MNDHRPWINFKELRARLDFEKVLRYYKVEVRRRGDQHLGTCPLPGHPQEKRGNTFSANIPRGIFQCFGCRAKGNVLDFAGLMAGVDIEDGNALREIAVVLQREFFPEGASRRTRPQATGEEKRPIPTKVNEPLDFALKGLDPTHEALAVFGVKPETLAHFGVGFCSRGSLKGKIAVPIHDRSGALLGYASCAPGDCPEFSLPASREKAGEQLVFDARLVLYRAHQVKSPCVELSITDTIPSVWRLWEEGHEAVAVTGGHLTAQQVDAVVDIASPSVLVRRIVEAAKGKGRAEEAEALATRCFTRLVLAEAPLWTMTGDEIELLFA